MSRPVRLGIAGCGRLAEVGYLPALALTDAVELVAVADPDGERVAHIARLAGRGVRRTPDVAAMVAEGDLDAVVLASPADSHVDAASLVVAAGLPVLVEKPPAPDAAGAARLAALGPSVRVGFNRRFDAGARAVRAAVREHGPVTIDVAIQYRRASWNPHTVRDDVLLDLAPHLVDWIRWLAGQDIVDVRTEELSPDRARLRLAGTRGSATLTAAADRFHAESIVVTDEHGAVVARHRVGGPVAAVTDRLRPRGGPHPLAASLAAQLEAFATVVRGGTDDDLATAGDGLAVMTVIDTAREQSSC